MTATGSPSIPDERETALALLRWYVEMGADEAIDAEPANRFAAVAAPIPAAVPRPKAGPAVAAAPAR